MALVVLSTLSPCLRVSVLSCFPLSLVRSFALSRSLRSSLPWPSRAVRLRWGCRWRRDWTGLRGGGAAAGTAAGAAGQPDDHRPPGAGANAGRLGGTAGRRPARGRGLCLAAAGGGAAARGAPLGGDGRPDRAVRGRLGWLPR